MKEYKLEVESRASREDQEIPAARELRLLQGIETPIYNDEDFVSAKSDSSSKQKEGVLVQVDFVDKTIDSVNDFIADTNNHSFG